mmetsp:Transcript_23335/g.75967  ORF Transcript_23335/g.75967 Transcript_23335/m.75967 type:complete len:386 (-) Transcript_23335:108-1265(-)
MRLCFSVGAGAAQSRTQRRKRRKQPNVSISEVGLSSWSARCGRSGSRFARDATSSGGVVRVREPEVGAAVADVETAVAEPAAVLITAAAVDLRADRVDAHPALAFAALVDRERRWFARANAGAARPHRRRVRRRRCGIRRHRRCGHRGAARRRARARRASDPAQRETLASARFQAVRHGVEPDLLERLLDVCKHLSVAETLGQQALGVVPEHVFDVGAARVGGGGEAGHEFGDDVGGCVVELIERAERAVQGAWRGPRRRPGSDGVSAAAVATTTTAAASTARRHRSGASPRRASALAEERIVPAAEEAACATEATATEAAAAAAATAPAARERERNAWENVVPSECSSIAPKERGKLGWDVEATRRCSLCERRRTCAQFLSVSE